MEIYIKIMNGFLKSPECCTLLLVSSKEMYSYAFTTALINVVFCCF